MRSHAPSDGLDIRSMRILLMLLSECSVTRTAELMGQPQPTISLALRRLRAVFADPLLVRNGNKLVPTDRGRELIVSLRRILADLDGQLNPDTSFRPERTGHHFKLLLANCFGATFLPRIIKRIRNDAPSATVDVSPMPAFDTIAPLLADGVVDIALGNWPRPPDKMRMLTLFPSDIVCLVHGRHHYADLTRLTVAQYLDADHLSLTPSTNSAMSPIDGRLAELGWLRRIAASVPDYGNVPYVLAQTELMFTTSRHFADHLAGVMPLSMLGAPREFGVMTFYALWHERNHRSAAHRWLREVIKDVARETDMAFRAGAACLAAAG